MVSSITQVDMPVRGLHNKPPTKKISRTFLSIPPNCLYMWLLDLSVLVLRYRTVNGVGYDPSIAITLVVGLIGSDAFKPNTHWDSVLKLSI